MRAFAIFGVKTGTLWVFIAHVSTIVDAINVVIFTVMCAISVRPMLDPVASALSS